MKKTKEVQKEDDYDIWKDEDEDDLVEEEMGEE